MKRPGLIPFLVFALAFIFFFVLQYNHTLADPDSFYHAKMALLMREQGVVRDFPWLGNFTVLGDSFTDQHFLYHLILIPFVSILHPIVGLKLATVILAGLFVLTFYFFIRRQGVRFPAVFALALLLMGPLVFRISLPKAPSLSLILLFIGLWLIIKGRWRLAFPFAFFYVWAYGGFPLIIITSGLYLIVEIETGIISAPLRRLKLKKLLFPKAAWLTFFSTVAGVFSGLVLNPYFPQNLEFYRYQLVEIGMRNYHNVIGVGGEWYPYGLFSLFTDSIFLTIFLIIALTIFVINWRKQSRREIFFFCLTIFFLILTIKSRRYVEYYVPLGCLFSLTVIGRYLTTIKLDQLAKNCLHLPKRVQAVLFLALVYFFITVPALMVKNFMNDMNDLKNGIPYTKFSRASAWLKEHSQPKEIVVHSSWDEFPTLFYHNDFNTYIGGLDQTFMYLYNKELHRKWVDLTTGNLTENIAQTIRQDFQARYVLVSQKHDAMKRALAKDRQIVKRYEDDEASVYEVLEK